MHFFDAHTHTHFAAFDKDWKETIQRALDANVWLINVGTQQDTSRRAVEVAHEFPEGVFAAVGLHPIHTEASYHDAKELGASPSTSSGFTSRGEEFDYDYYKKLAVDPKVVAIGECGLDYYRCDKGQETRDRQKKAFLAQIELAHAVQKPLMIHCRDAFHDLIDTLVACRSSLVAPPGVVHFFTGSLDDTKKLLELGFSFTFGGVITFAREYDSVLKYLPLERIISETDAPYVTPAPHRGKRNEPSYVVEVTKKLAEVKGIPLETAQEQVFKNAKRIFGF
jgi:TatD DNase family protein